ncbi:MAG: glycosyl transferase family 2 [Pseudomonadota bacterium]
MALPISVIIPLAPGEVEWEKLLSQLTLPDGSEIILAVGPQNPEIKDDRIRLVTGAPGRAQQMNEGAKEAINEVLWFLHADSRLSPIAQVRLQQRLSDNADALYFFDLRFSDDGPTATILNEWAVRIRAGFLKMPFGDQGFCVSKKLFEELGGYREDAEYGEDHLFVWSVRQSGYPVERVAAEIFTSARKYHSNGWFATTAKHVWLTALQALPQFVILLRKKFGRLRS